MAQIKVIHLELEGKHYYFGSPKAMFDTFGKAELGMSYASFHSNIHLKMGVPYVNARRGYTIRLGILEQAKTNRNNKISQRLREMEQQAVLSNSPAEVAAQPANAAETPAAAAPAKRKKKNSNDVPEQLTLF